jgi:ABC-type transporter Mla subunit MlaD
MSLLAQDEALTRKVGAATLLVVAAAIAFVAFVYDRIDWGDDVRIAVYFRHTGGLREGAPIVVAGRAIGEIESIALSPRGAPDTPLGGEEGVKVLVAIDEDAASRIVRGGDVFVASRGPLGARYLELGPAPAALQHGPSLARDRAPLKGSDPPSIDRVLQRTWDNLTIARNFADAIRPEMTLLRARLVELQSTLDSIAPDAPTRLALGVELRALAAEFRTLRDVSLGGTAGRDLITAVLADSRTTLAHARRTLATLSARFDALATSSRALRARLADRGPAGLRSLELAIERIRTAIAKVDPLLAKVEDLNARIARGEGSLGKLMKDPEFPEDAKALGKILKRQPWKVIQRPPD